MGSPIVVETMGFFGYVNNYGCRTSVAISSIQLSTRGAHRIKLSGDRHNLVGGFNPSEEYESQWEGLLFTYPEVPSWHRGSLCQEHFRQNTVLQGHLPHLYLWWWEDSWLDRKKTKFVIKHRTIEQGTKQHAVVAAIPRVFSSRSHTCLHARRQNAWGLRVWLRKSGDILSSIIPQRKKFRRRICAENVWWMLRSGRRSRHEPIEIWHLKRGCRPNICIAEGKRCEANKQFPFRDICKHCIIVWSFFINSTTGSKKDKNKW